MLLVEMSSGAHLVVSIESSLDLSKTSYCRFDEKGLVNEEDDDLKGLGDGDFEVKAG